MEVDGGAQVALGNSDQCRGEQGMAGGMAALMTLRLMAELVFIAVVPPADDMKLLGS